MDNQNHLTDDQLILFMDRELEPSATAVAQQHLLSCVACDKRLQHFQRGSTAINRHHNQILQPSLHVPVNGWTPLGRRLAPKQRLGWQFFGAAAALAGAMALAFIYIRPAIHDPGAQAILEQASAAPESFTGSLVLTTGNQSMMRPAVWNSSDAEPRFQHIKGLFNDANYSWEKPLSARSFVAWRKALPAKSDYITSVPGDNGRRFYRIRTRTQSGILRSASLTLEYATYHPTKAAFEFQGEDLIEITEQQTEITPKPKELNPALSAKPVETMATPEDELRVFAALDAVGTDAEEPIEVKFDSTHHLVAVTGVGIAPARRKQIEAALSNIPNTTVHFNSGQPLSNESAPRFNSDNNAPVSSEFQKKLQDRAGGTHELQLLTDQSLESSNALFAQSHSLLVLAQEFPSPVEQSLSPPSATTLLALRQRRLGANYLGTGVGQYI